MLPMATSTGSRRNLKALHAAGWALMITPDNPNPHHFRFAIDNGAWSCHQKKQLWTPARWSPLVERHGAAAIFAVAPDIVCGGPESLVLSLQWLSWLLERTSVALIAVQNGMTAEDLAPHLGPRVGIFVGGDTTWKESSLPMWDKAAQVAGCYLHVGRVNTARRIRLCAMAGADSFDGTSASKFSCTVPLLTSAAAQTALRFL